MPRRVASLIGITIGSVLSAGLLPAAALASTQASSPAQLLVASLAACRAQHSVQWASSASLNGETGTIKTNAGRTSGIQFITVTKSGSTGHVTIELMKNTGYLKGDSFALQVYMGFKPSDAKKEANRWLSLAPSNMDFSAVTAGLTMTSTASELEMTGPFTATPRSIVLGEHVIGVKGMSKPQPGGVPAFKSVVYMRAAGLPLPVEDTQLYEGHTSITTYRNWNESVVLQKPTGAVPLLVSWLE